MAVERKISKEGVNYQRRMADAWADFGAEIQGERIGPAQKFQGPPPYSEIDVPCQIYVRGNWVGTVGALLEEVNLGPDVELHEQFEAKTL